ncbi:RNA polymerase sigma-70 factor [Terrimonas sp. NA20]|uniref:RNA polymerase sigma-70 factor n=1 Tax=Terrimonas ginsenosidimutans TaxID=2908004 RepID=A0ABS9KM78_9BACT|nr:RNA polymerase sigma-70 factor [Terrimonas ginsenosidimutans]MCG2613422.1 RNA polymerase sigma-70 factor [Terrimonas ginsenosidimutans]
MRPDDLYLKSLQQQIEGGSQQAFSGLFRLLYPRLLSFALQYVHVKEIAEEITNDVFIKLWNRKEHLDEVNNISTYLFVSVKNLSLNYLKRYSHLHVAVEDNEGDASLINLDDPEQQLEWKEMSFQLTQAIDSLPDQCRTVFKLIKEDGFRYKEVAEILGISPRTVETQLFRAMKKLQALISPANTAAKRNRKLPPAVSTLIPLLFLFY